MMSSHGANPIFFNKKIKIGRREHSLTPHPPTSNNISFLPYTPPPPLLPLPLKADINYVSPLNLCYSLTAVSADYLQYHNPTKMYNKSHSVQY